MPEPDEMTASDDLEPVSDVGIAPTHRAWMNIQIEQALEQKRSGKATYQTLDEIRRKFGVEPPMMLHPD